MKKPKKTQNLNTKQNKYYYKSLYLFVLVFVLGVASLIIVSAKISSQITSSLSQRQVSAYAGQGFIIDHNSIALFDQIPTQYFEAAKNLRVLTSDRSVGNNINDGLTCLAYTSDELAPIGCKRSTHYDPNYSSPTSEFNWSKSFDRSNITYEYRAGGWSELTRNFVQDLVPQYVSQKDVLMYHFSYLNIVSDGSPSLINDPVNGFLVAKPGNDSSWDVSDIENLEQLYPSKFFIYSTPSISRRNGNEVATDFNQQLRQYALQNNKILFDLAAIESHDLDGSPCYDNRDGVQSCGPNGICENYPDDGYNYESICRRYTDEIEGGHLGAVSAGKIRIAKAYWVMLARLAGWNPGGGVYPTQPPQPTPTIPTQPTSTPAPQATVTPTPPITGLSLNVSNLEAVVKMVNDGWQMRFEVTVEDQFSQPVEGVTLEATITSPTQSLIRTCITGRSSMCPMSSIRNTLDQYFPVRITINSLAKDGYTYNSVSNHDIDGDSNGTTLEAYRSL